ncbi:MAG: hypothetical protein NTV22_05605, partial [bacterium]|nr:hypothetical protein [bacterium]
PLALNDLQGLAINVWERVQPSLAMILLWVVIVNIAGSIGAVLCGIGILFSMPIAMLALTISYLAIFRNEKPVLPAA